MSRITTLAVDINVNITDETAYKCLNLLNMYLEGSRQKLKEMKYNDYNDHQTAFDYYQYEFTPIWEGENDERV